MTKNLSQHIDELKKSENVLVQAGAILKMFQATNFQEKNYNMGINNAVIQYTIEGIYSLVSQSTDAISDVRYELEQSNKEMES